VCERDAFDSSRPVKLLTIVKTVIKLKRFRNDDNCNIIKLIRLRIMIMIMIMITLILFFVVLSPWYGHCENSGGSSDECACRWSPSDEVNRLVL